MPNHSNSNDNICVNVKLINTDDEVFIPVRKHKTDVGADVRSREDMTIPAGETAIVPLGVCLEIPQGAWVKIEGRSSLAMNGIYPIGGIIDEGYRGEVKVFLRNGSAEDFEISKGDRIAQMILCANYAPEYTLVQEFPDITDRGENGFGSTGVK